MELDLATRWLLSFFAAAAVGSVLGYLVARVSTFELGLAVALLILGAVSLSFTVAFVRGYRELAYDPRRVPGTVVAVEDRPTDATGDVTMPVAIVEYETPDGVTQRVDGPRASSLKTGDVVVVVPRHGSALPRRVGVPRHGSALPRRVGVPRDMQGGAIASMLFGTFPLSAGVFFLVSALAPERTARDEARSAARQERSYWNVAANLLVVCGIVATPFFATADEAGGVARALMLGFAVVGLGLWLHVVHGARVGRDPRWTLGVGVVAVNFSAWVVALWFLTDPAAGW
jgi:hypothetical protein